MHSEIKLGDLLRAMVAKVGRVSRLAAGLKVTERTLRTWLGKSEDELHRLHHDNIEQIIQTARDMELEPEMFAPPPLLWDSRKSYDENILFDPGLPPRFAVPFRSHSIPFLGYTLDSRFGASASVLTSTSARIRFLFEAGPSVVTYKTVRSDFYKAHPPTNIFYCSKDAPLLVPDFDPPSVLVDDYSENYRPAYGMMNRFGMPSPPREVWQADFRAAKSMTKAGQLLILSVVGTANREDPETVLIEDCVRVVEYALDAGAEVIEINLSCPNCSGMEGELYHNLGLVESICKAVSAVIGNAKIILKIGYMRETDLREFVYQTGAYVHGYSAINTVAVEGFRDGQNSPVPAFGTPGLKAGLSGPPILRCGLRTVQNLSRIRSEQKLENLGIIGIGGAMTTANVQSYIDSGADIVQCTNGFFADSFFGIRVRRFLDAQLTVNLRTAEEDREAARMNWSKAVTNLEYEFGGNDEIWATVQTAALQEILEWERSQKSAAALGPRRVLAIPTVEEFKQRIRRRLSLPA